MNTDRNQERLAADAWDERRWDKTRFGDTTGTAVEAAKMDRRICIVSA